MTLILQGILKEGMIYAIMALGVYITYKILDFPDLSVDGTFPLGSAVTAMLLVKDVNPYIAMIASMLTGAVAGMITGIIHVKFKVRDLLSGIIMMTGLYSVNYMIVGSRANVSLDMKSSTVFSNPLTLGVFGSKSVEAPLDYMRDYKKIIILVLILIVLKIIIDLFMSSKRGYLLRAMGDNPIVVATLAKNGGNIKIMGLSIANALVALSGSLFCQYNSAFNITDGTGKMVIGLASVIIGVNIFGRLKFIKNTTAVTIGAIVYTACVTLALDKFDAQVMKLVTAVLFLVVLVVGQVRIGSFDLFSKKGGENK